MTESYLPQRDIKHETTMNELEITRHKVGTNTVLLIFIATMSFVILCILIFFTYKYFQVVNAISDIGDTFNDLNLDPSPTP